MQKTPTYLGLPLRTGLPTDFSPATGEGPCPVTVYLLLVLVCLE